MIVIDNFLKENKVIEILKNENTWKNFPTYNWWDGWWKIEPRNIMEHLIKIIWSTFSRVENNIAGFEYWSNLHSKKGKLDWHADKDERLITEKGELSQPRIGHIYYIKTDELNGGYLELSNSQITEKIYENKLERIKPIENRLIMFDPSKAHRVTEILDGNRRAFLANAWKKKPYTFINSENVNYDENKKLVDVNWENKKLINF